MPLTTAADDEPKLPRRRRLTLRVVGFLLLLLIVLGAAAGAIGYYARDTYYVGLASGVGNRPAQVIIFKGRPGGLLWFKPTVAERTQSTSADVLPSRLPDLRAGKIEANLDLARRYIGNLLTEAAAVHPSSTTLPPLPSGSGVTTTAP
jgi:protein phosphatase